MTGFFTGMSTEAIMALLGTLAASYAIGSLPWAYIVVRTVTGEDVTTHGSGNVGAMNVRRTTGSWLWFGVAMVADFLKGTAPAAVAKWYALRSLVVPVGVALSRAPSDRGWLVLFPMTAVAGAVLGHNYSVWMAVLKRSFGRTGKGLSTGAGALLAYDWRYFAVVVAVGLATIAATRYMMAGQVAGAASLPITALVLRMPDWPFALAMGAVVYAAHHKRFLGMLKGREPRFYIHDRSGPRG